MEIGTKLDFLFGLLIDPKTTIIFFWVGEYKAPLKSTPILSSTHIRDIQGNTQYRLTYKCIYEYIEFKDNYNIYVKKYF